jgi:hypothetical protein
MRQLGGLSSFGIEMGVARDSEERKLGFGNP